MLPENHKLPIPFLKNAAGLVHGDETIDLVDEMIEYIDSEWPTPSLTPQDEGLADDICSDVFSKFCWFIREVNKDSKGAFF